MKNYHLGLFGRKCRNKTGVIADNGIIELVNDGQLQTASPLAQDQIQPASVDLRLSDKVYRVRASFLPGNNCTVRRRLTELALHEINITNGAVLETGCVYIAELLESTSLSPGLSASANPKSSTGRLDIFTRLITDNASEFDKVTSGYRGPLYLEISPKTFPILVRRGSRLAQLRFHRGNARLTDQELGEIHRLIPLTDHPDPIFANGLVLSVDLSGEDTNGLIGYVGRRHTDIIDIDKALAYDPLDYWQPLTTSANQQRLILDPNAFYILVSLQAISIPPNLAGEMVPIDTLVGEFRVHYAGFFDPGFGYSPTGTLSSRAVLEVRSHNVPFIIEHQQNIGRLIYEKMLNQPDKLYGVGSHYQSQRLKLSKHFCDLKKTP